MPDVILGRAMQTNQIIPISDVERRSGLYILGRMGRGKTSLMTKLIEQDMANGHGVFFLDPHGDAVEDLQQRIPSDRQNDVIVLDPSDKLYSFGLNPLACADPDDMTQRSGTYAHAMAIFQKLFANIQTEELDILLNQYLRNSFFPLIANQGCTLLEIPLLLEDKPFRDRLLEHPSVRPEVVRFWHTKFDRLSPTDRDKETASTARRLDQFQDFDEIRHIVGQERSTIDFFTIMQERKILFVKLKKTLPGDAWRIIGTLLISSLVHAVREREQLAEDERYQFCIFVDEFQNFASSEDFAVLFTEARKYGIATTIAHQERYGQFADNKRIAGATDAAVIKLFFQPTPHDAAEQAVEFAERAQPTEPRREAELVISPRPIEDIWERGHPHADIMYIRDRFFWLVEALRSKPQEPYFLFDRTRITPEHMKSNPVDFRFEEFDDWEYYRSSADDIRRGISLLNQYYYDCMRGKYNGSEQGITNPQLQLMQTVITYLGGVFGFLPMYRPYIPDSMRVALFRALERYKPRSSLYSSNGGVWYDSGARGYKSRTWLYEHKLKRLINAPEFPRTLLPSWVWERITEDEKYGWRIDYDKLDTSIERRKALFRLVLGIKSDTSPTIDDIPTTLSNQAELQGFQKLASYIGMSLHELENLIAWEPRPLTGEERDVIQHVASKFAKTLPTPNERRDCVRSYIQAMSKRLSEEWRASDTATNRLSWQISELVLFIGMCLNIAPERLRDFPVKLPSGKYSETLKVERTQQDLNNDMVQELLELQPHTAYVKKATWKGKIQSVVIDKAAAALLEASRIELVDVRGIARDNAVRDLILRKRGDIEAEIRERQERWRHPPDTEPPSPTTGGDSSPPSPPGDTGQAQEPPPTIYPADSSEDSPPSRDEAQSHHDGRIIDFTTYALQRRREEARRRRTTRERPEAQTAKAPRPPDIPIPRYEPLDYSSGAVTIHDFRERLAPLVRYLIPHYERIDTDETAASPLASLAISLQDTTLAIRALHITLGRLPLPAYACAIVGRLAAMLGDATIAEEIIERLEEADHYFHDLEAGSIAARLADKTTAQRLLRKFEENEHTAAALALAAAMSESETMRRLLTSVVKYGLRVANKGQLGETTKSLIKAVPYHPDLGKKIIPIIEHKRGVQYVTNDFEYLAAAGKLAAVLGEKTYAIRAMNACLWEAAFMPAAEIAALLGDVPITDTIVSKYCDVTKDLRDLHIFDLGFVIGTIANHDVQTAEKLWMRCADTFGNFPLVNPKDDVFNAHLPEGHWRPSIARAVLDNLAPPPALRQQHPMAPSTDPVSHLSSPLLRT
jgi:hypothetical protein